MNYKGEGGTQDSQGVIGLGGAAGPGSILTISTLGHQILRGNCYCSQGAVSFMGR